MLHATGNDCLAYGNVWRCLWCQTYRKDDSQILDCVFLAPRPSCQDEAIEYEPDAKEFLQHVDKVVFVRRIPSWVSTEELGRQVPFPALSVPHSVRK